MPVHCRLCGQDSPESAYFCISCGAVLRIDPRGPHIRPLSATSPTVRLHPQSVCLAAPKQPAAAAPSRLSRGALLRLIGVPLLALIYAVFFLIGILQFLETGGLSTPGLYILGPVVGGALFAEEAWVRGKHIAGLGGMIVWGSMPWIIAAGFALPWGLLLGGSWCMAHLWRRIPHPQYQKATD